MSNVAKPSNNEEEFIAREEAERKRKMHSERAGAQTAAQKEDAKKLHWMKCPKCGSELHEVSFKGVQVDRCFGCHGVFLDNGELEALAGKEEGYIKSVIHFFMK